ncbi:MAG: glycosyltransferase family 4 protein [Lentisphaerae bacterium]|nr:glycosyltransferase family 4 protein [Lentisphaerota bacterium]OQC12024.1 MAG: GDP-mannose-dependent alpha-(1-6)-phosphatidylinositol monomannoside mannosyltransferase [Lentisphaerae bacterium ADurb.Bin082]HQL88774.1 glycosyltransferase family 4 protein [Lentisphaeria bacterium]
MRAILGLTATALLAAASLVVGIVHCRLYRQCRQQYEATLSAMPCKLVMDSGAAGEVSAPYQQSSQLAHGVTLYLQVPEGVAMATHEDARQALGSVFGTLTLRQGEDIVREGDLAVQYRAEIIEAEGAKWLPVGSLDPTLPLGDYTLTIHLTSPLAALAEQPMHLIARYECCGLEKLPQYVALAIALVALAVFVILLWPVASLSRQVRRQSRAPTCDGDGILYLLTAYPLWSETFLRLDLRLLQRRNLPIHAVALYAGDTEVKPDWPSVRVLSKKPAPRSIAARRSAKFGIRATLARLLPKWLRAQWSLRRHRDLLQSLLEECREKRIGHIHAEFADLAALLGTEAARQLGCTFSVGIHAFDIHACKFPLRRLFGDASFITVCNEAAAEAFRERCPWAADRLHVIYHGLELKQWPYVERIECEPCLKLLFVGRLVPKKGVSILLKALSLIVSKDLQAVQLTIIGDGPLGTTLRRQAERDGLSNLIRWKGVLDQDAVKEHLRQSSCLCVPSIVDADGDRDGIPNVVTEAMATGLPVVGSQAGSLPEALTAETGWPVADLTPESLADAILEMASQPDERERRRKSARQHIEYRFNAKKSIESRGKLFEQALNRRRT